MAREILNKIKDITTQSRDLPIDDLSTLLEYESLSDDEQHTVVSELVRFLEEDSVQEDAVVESIFNLLGIVFFQDKYTDLIANVSAKMLPRLMPGSLVHALLIIGESNLPNKVALIEKYLNSDNPAIRSAAQEAMRH
ncbi:hypothetical protein [Leptolyngbya sp. 7M]|uniref:hypothetical protein n=1 Tax=Leptolyngbya sp. 7M TaxID=2812896 RepID=UPI001B8B50D3|nr:hypothetical protein [Leptolyngbya sp. 7M]QYO67757.1 hypothetical protein JVX88_13790 [Leptolyngbya sp. 7M]